MEYFIDTQDGDGIGPFKSHEEATEYSKRVFKDNNVGEDFWSVISNNDISENAKDIFEASLTSPREYEHGSDLLSTRLYNAFTEKWGVNFVIKYYDGSGTDFFCIEHKDHVYPIVEGEEKARKIILPLQHVSEWLPEGGDEELEQVIKDATGIEPEGE